jgi:glycosyltransferase involved in cell wall biosynthesis
MIGALAAAGRLAGLIVLAGDFPRPGRAAAAAAAARLDALPDGAWLVVDGLALVPLAEVFARHAGRLRLIALVHHPLADETGLDAADRDRFLAAERAALARVAAIVATSETTRARLAAAFAPPATPIVVVPPGTADRRPPPRRPAPPHPVRLLGVGSLTPRKGQDRLVRALSPLRRHPWRLTLVGPPRDAGFARRLRLLVHGLGLRHRICVAGAVPAARLARHYRRADVFVLPSLHEGWGIAFVEAAAHRLPVVAHPAGALPEALAGAAVHWVGAAPDARAAAQVLAGALGEVRPEMRPEALAAVLRPLLARPEARRRSQAAAGRPGRLRTWAAAGRDFVTAIGRIIRP